MAVVSSVPTATTAASSVATHENAAAVPTTSSIPQTALGASISRTSPAAALTTPFVAPQKCQQEDSRFANTACMPPNWDAYWYGNVGYYSPAVCPQSYGVVASRPANVAVDSGYGPAPLNGEVAVMCCPSGYITVSNSASFCSSASSSAYAVQVRWQFSDIPHLQGITDMIAEVSAMPTGGYSTITAVSGPTHPAKPSSDGGLSTGGQVAIGIFVPLLILSLFAGGLIFFLRRRQRKIREGMSSPNSDKSAFHSHASSNTSVTLRVTSYLTDPGSTKGSKSSKSNLAPPQMQEAYDLPPLRSPSPANRQSHVSLATMPDPSTAETQGKLEANTPDQIPGVPPGHKPAISLTIPTKSYLAEPEMQLQQHGDTPLLPRAPTPEQFHPAVELNQSMSPALDSYGYSRMQRLSREDSIVSPQPAFVAPLPPPTADRPEPLRIRQSATGQPMPKVPRRCSSTPSLSQIQEVVHEDRYMVPPGSAAGEPHSRPTSNLFSEDQDLNHLTTATFQLSPGATEDSPSYIDRSPMQMPHQIAELEATVKPLSTASAKSAHVSPHLAPQSSPPRSKSAMDKPLRLDVETLEPPPRCKSALDQSPTSVYSSDDTFIPFRSTIPQALPRVFSQKRTGTAVTPKMDIKQLPKLAPVPDYAGQDYGDTSATTVDVQDEEMFRRVRERRMLEERERRLERAVDARYSWRGAHGGGHKRMSQSFG